MIGNKETFSSKDPTEIIPLSFDFATVTISPSNPVVDVSRVSGNPDPSPASMKSGAPQIVGTTIRQMITGGVSGTLYSVRCQIDAPDGSRWVLAAQLPVETL